MHCLSRGLMAMSVCEANQGFSLPNALLPLAKSHFQDKYSGLPSCFRLNSTRSLKLTPGKISHIVQVSRQQFKKEDLEFYEEALGPNEDDLEWDPENILEVMTEYFAKKQAEEDCRSSEFTADKVTELIMQSEPQYTSFIDPASGQPSAVEGNRTSFSPFIMAAAKERSDLYFPEPPQGDVVIDPKKWESFVATVIETEEQNIYEEEEAEEDDSKQSRDPEAPLPEEQFVKYFGVDPLPQKAEKKVQERRNFVLEARARVPDHIQPIRPSKWTAPPAKSDGLLLGIRESNEILRQMWAERGARGEPFVPQEGELENVSSADDEMWIHQRGPKLRDDYDKKYKHPPSSEYALALAAAEFGQIKLYGTEPTVTESMLARARKKALKEERLMMEQRLRERLGLVGYLRLYCAAYPGDTSEEAVRRRSEEEGVSLLEQVAELMRWQTDHEFRVMMSAMDTRLRRDPLEYRMTTEQIKRVWGGDPVMPTAAYETDRDRVLDFRGPEFHDYTKAPFDYVVESGRAITREQLQKVFEKEKLLNVESASKAKQRRKALAQVLPEEEEEAILLDEEDNEEEEEEEEDLEIDSLAEADPDEVADSAGSRGARLELVGPLGTKTGAPNVKLVGSKDGAGYEMDSGEDDGVDKEEPAGQQDDWLGDFEAFVGKGDGGKGPNEDRGIGGNGQVNGVKR